MKKALMFGLNYALTSCPLNGCIRDIDLTRSLLIERGFASFVVLKDDGSTIPASKQNILAAMRKFSSEAKPGDILFVCFSGHGGRCPGTFHEKDSCNECLYDHQLNEIYDDNIKEELVDPLPAGCFMYIHFDSCHSGSAADLPFDLVILESRAVMAPPSSSFVSSKWDHYKWKEDKVASRSVSSLVSVVPEYTQPSGIKATVLMISGCKDSQTAADDFYDVNKATRAEGAMSHAFREVLSTLKTPTFYDLFRGMLIQIRKSGYDQVPQMSCSTDKLDICTTKVWF